MQRAVAMVMLMAAGCATSPAPSVHIAVLPVRWATDDPLPADEREPLVEGLRATSGQSVSTPESDCAEESCAQHAGQAAEADRVVLASMAALGQTALARVVVLDVELGTREQTRQEVIPTLEPEDVRARLVALGESVGEPFAPHEASAFYEQAWFWTVIGVALVGGAVATTLALTLDGGEGPDFTVVPP